jgi:hypothetical protein
LENVIEMIEDLHKEELRKIDEIKAYLKVVDMDKCLINMKSLPKVKKVRF